MKEVIPVIDPNSIFTVPTARALLGLAQNCLPREIRMGRLRVAKRAGRYFITGAWLMEWIESGERPRRRELSQAEQAGQPMSYLPVESQN